MKPSSDSFIDILQAGASQMGLHLGSAQIDQMRTLVHHLLDWNQRMNLTAVRTVDDVAVKHILDSLTCFSAITFPENARVLDVGTGAGFPGLVLQIHRPDLKVTMLDSTTKKLSFVQHAATTLGLTHAATLFGRAEELGRLPEHREQYDIVVARAVAPLRILSELCLPFVSQLGCFLAMKGPNVCAEIPTATKSILYLGGHPGDVIPFVLPFDGGDRAILPITKVGRTPPECPRLYRDIRRDPL